MSRRTETAYKAIIRASQHDMTKSHGFRRNGKCCGCVATVHVLIRGDLPGFAAFAVLIVYKSYVTGPYEQLVVLAKERGRLTISDAVTLLDVNRNTTKLHFRQLVESGHLVLHGTGRASWYTAGNKGQ